MCKGIKIASKLQRAIFIRRTFFSKSKFYQIGFLSKGDFSNKHFTGALLG